MNNRMKRKQEKRKRQKIDEIFDLALQINGLSDRKRKITGDLPTVFVYYSGHISQANIQIHSNGWEAREDPDMDFYLGLNSENYSEKEMKKCYSELLKIRDSIGGIDD